MCPFRPVCFLVVRSIAAVCGPSMKLPFQTHLLQLYLSCGVHNQSLPSTPCVHDRCPSHRSAHAGDAGPCSCARAMQLGRSAVQTLTQMPTTKDVSHRRAGTTTGKSTHGHRIHAKPSHVGTSMPAGQRAPQSNRESHAGGGMLAQSTPHVAKLGGIELGDALAAWKKHGIRPTRDGSQQRRAALRIFAQLCAIGRVEC